MLDAHSEKTVAHIAEQMRAVFGTDLVSLTLYGSGAGEDFVPGRSDLNMAVVVKQVTFAHLKALNQHLPKWHKLGLAVPLLLDRRSLDRGRDVFPMEFYDIKAQHRVLYGEEVFATLEIDGRHLRYQAEHEVRGKLLRLRALFAEVGADHTRLRALLLDSVKTFIIVMRSLVRLRVGQGRTRYLEVLAQFEEHTAVRFPTMRHLLQVKLGTEQWAKDLEESFRTYLAEVERLVELIDDMYLQSDSAHPTS